MRNLAAAILILLACVSFASGAPPQSGIDGKVADPLGAAIANARILIHWDPAGSKVGLFDNVGVDHDVSVSTDEYGRYSINVPAGFYDVYVSAMAFTPTAVKVRLKVGKRSTYDSKLVPDPLVLRELD